MREKKLHALCVSIVRESFKHKANFMKGADFAFSTVYPVYKTGVFLYSFSQRRGTPRTLCTFKTYRTFCKYTKYRKCYLVKIKSLKGELYVCVCV